MVFAHDSEVALAHAAALVNTDQDDGDELADVAALDAWLDEWAWTGTRRHTQAELDAVRALRPVFRSAWTMTEDDLVDLVNRMLREAQVMPQLVKHDGWDYHLHPGSQEDPIEDRMAGETALALVDVVRQQELGRLRICAAEGCENLLVDLSKNRSRRFCDTSCANRTHVAAFRARRA